MTTQELLKALACLTACDRPSVARDAAAQLPDWLDLVDVLRAVDGCQLLAQALDTHRRQAA